MGFFSNKKEKDKVDDILKQVMSSVFKNCPICAKDNFQIMDMYTGHKDFGNGMSSASAMFDMKAFAGGTVGVCSNCGFVAHGKKYYKGKNFDDSFAMSRLSLMIVNDWNESLQEILKNDNADDNVLNSEFATFIKKQKTLFPEVFKEVDVLGFIKTCFDFKYKLKFNVTENTFQALQ